MSETEPLSESEREAAVAAFRLSVAKANGQTLFARICGCTQGNISQLLKKNALLPARYVLKAEHGTGVSRHALRPDVYGRKEDPFHETPAGRTLAGRGPVAACDRSSKLQLGEPVR